MEVILLIIAVLAGVIGLLGVIVPVLPGTILSFLGLLCIYFTPTTTLSLTALIIWGVVAVVVMALDYILPGYFSKAFGGTKAGITGATVGTFVGILFGVPGILLGPFFGAVAGEMMSGKLPFEEALKVGLGSLMSFIVGSGLKLIVGGMMLYYIVKDVIIALSGMF